MPGKRGSWRKKLCKRLYTCTSLLKAPLLTQTLIFLDCDYRWKNSYDMNKMIKQAAKFILCLPFLTNISYKERLMSVNLLPVCYWHELLDLVYFYKATHNMIHLDPSVVPFVRECARRTRISVTSSQSFVPKKCRTSTFQKSFFIRTTRIWNLLITRLDLSPTLGP